MTVTRRNARSPAVVIGLALVVASVTLAVLSANVSYGMTRQRESTCDGRIPMPVSAFVLGWTAIGLAALVVVLVIALGGGPLRGRDGATAYPAGRFSLAVLVPAALAIAFDAYVLYTVYQDAPLQRFICSG